MTEINIIKPIIVKITFNFVQFNDGTEASETYELAEVGKMFPFGKKKDPETGKMVIDSRKIKAILESRCKSYYTIHFEDKSKIRVYNPNMVYYENVLNNE